MDNCGSAGASGSEREYSNNHSPVKMVTPSRVNSVIYTPSQMDLERNGSCFNSSSGTQNHEERRFHPPKPFFFGSQKQVFDSLGCQKRPNQESLS